MVVRESGCRRPKLDGLLHPHVDVDQVNRIESLHNHPSPQPTHEVGVSMQSVLLPFWRVLSHAARQCSIQLGEVQLAHGDQL